MHHSHVPKKEKKKRTKKRSGESRCPQKPLIMLWNVMIVSWLEQNGLCVRALHLTTIMKCPVFLCVCVCVFSFHNCVLFSHAFLSNGCQMRSVGGRWGGSPGDDSVSPHWFVLTMCWRNWLKRARSRQQRLLWGVTNGHKRTQIGGKMSTDAFIYWENKHLWDVKGIEMVAALECDASPAAFMFLFHLFLSF